MRNLLLLLLLSAHGYCQENSLTKIRQYRIEQQHSIMNDFFTFISIPNVAADIKNIQKNASWIANYMRTIGIDDVQLFQHASEKTPPVVYGEVLTPGANTTIIFYAHYDGQPVDSTKWEQGLHPFKPVLFDGSLLKGGKQIGIPKDTAAYKNEWRIYGRGSSDDKAGVMAILNAYAAIKKVGLTPSINLKFFFEGEEEAGSTHLEDILNQYKDKLQSNMWIICDGPVHQSTRKQIVYGVRGDTHLELTVFGSNRPLHSGHYGNWAPNPAMQLAQLLSSMKDGNGHVTIKGFYDDVKPLTTIEKKAIANIPVIDPQLQNELGFVKSERKELLIESLNQPSLNINGLQSAGVGKLSANIIPTKAIASVDLRLVIGNDWKRQQDKVVEHIKQQGFFVTDKEPTDAERMAFDKICMVTRSDGYNAQKTSLDNPIAKQIVKAIKNANGVDPLSTPTLGGSLPLYVFEKVLQTHPITVPIANHDNNQHAENENLQLKNFWDGIDMFASIMLTIK